MNAKYVTPSDIVVDRLEWGELAWISRPSITKSKNITEILVTLEPGRGHDFHRHPRQEEVIYVLSGEIEQWLESEKKVLRPGEAVFVGAGVVHATFNATRQDVKFLVVLSPAVGEGGYEMEDVSGQAPWKGMRS